MNIKKENTDDLNAVVTVTIEEKDYEDRVNDVLKDYRKKARFDGFRPGNVPIGLIRKMYRKPVLMEEINKILGESVANYFLEEKLYIIGEPLPHEDDSEEIDWDQDKEFVFSFDIALAPEVDFSITDKDKIPYYTIKIDDDTRKKQIDQLKSRFGSFKESDQASENAMIKAEISEVDKEEKHPEGGINVEEGSFYVEFIQDKKIKDLFAGCKIGDSHVVDLKKAFTNETDLAGLLKVDKEKLGEIKNKFKVTVKALSIFEKAEINQELFDKAFGKDKVTTEDEFKTKVDEDLKTSFEHESDYQFKVDAREYFLKKFKKNIPDAFYKRWLLHVHDGKLTEEQMEKDYDQYVKDLKWQLIKSSVVREQDLKASEEELVQHVAALFRMQFMQYYGMADVPAEALENYAKEALKKEDERRKYVEMVLENKVYKFIMDTVKREQKTVSLDKFNKMREA